MRTSWTQEQVTDFREWHEKRMEQLNYPLELQTELRTAREVWMPPVDKNSLSNTDVRTK